MDWGTGCSSGLDRGCDSEIQICLLSARDVELATESALRAGRNEWPRFEVCDVGLELSRVAESVTIQDCQLEV